MKNKIKNSRGQASDIIMIAFFFIFVLYYLIGFLAIKIFFRAQNRAFDIVTRYAQHVSIKGIFTKNMYEEMLGDLANISCTYSELKLEAQERTITNTEMNAIEAYIDANPFVEGNIDTLPTERSKTIANLILEEGYRDTDITETEKNYRKEKGISKYMINLYTVPETIYNRTLSRGDTIYIRTSTEDVTLLGRMLSRPFFIIGTDAKSLNIAVVASVKAAVTVNGEYSGSEVIANFANFTEETLSNNLDSNHYIRNYLVLKNYKYNVNQQIQYNLLDQTPMYSTEGGKNYKLLNLNTNFYGNIYEVLEKSVGQEFWINPNATYKKTFERLRLNNDGTVSYLGEGFNSNLHQEVDGGVLQLDEVGVPILKQIMIIEEVVD